MAIEKDEHERVLVYNISNKKTEPEPVSSIQHYLKNRSLITATLISNNAETGDKAE